MSGRTIVESLLVLSLIGVLIWVFMGKYERVALAAKEETLKIELHNIKLTIKLFTVMNRRYPSDIKELTRGRYSIALPEGEFFEEEYIRRLKLDEEGNILDPFGNPYSYDPQTGKIRSQTPGYETW